MESFLPVEGHWELGVSGANLSAVSLESSGDGKQKNKKPEELVVWRGGAATADTDERWPVGRIMLPEQFATTFERLENNVALLLLLIAPPGTETRHPPAEAPRPIRAISTTGGLRAWPVSVRNGGSNLARTQELFPSQPKRTPASICLSSIIERTAAAYRGPEMPGTSSCYTVSVRQTNTHA
uniref:Uncharacterized protein n=1 Tax=Anopheles culicifacies TaxID=139723 RepID=A0A182MFZ1_9DIPT